MHSNTAVSLILIMFQIYNTEKQLICFSSNMVCNSNYRLQHAIAAINRKQLSKLYQLLISILPEALPRINNPYTC